MKKDFKNYSLHPTDEELADFIDNKLKTKGREEILEHLIYCDDCTEIVAGVMKRQSRDVKTPVRVKYANNWFYNGKIRAIVGSVVVASFMLIFVVPNFTSKQFSIGEIDLSKPIIQTMASSSKYQNRTVDGDNIVKEIEKKLDKTAISNFIEAQKAESQKDYNVAISLYKKSFRDAIKTFEGREKLQWQIVIYYHISKIKFETEDEDSDSYKKRVQFWIQQYSLGE